MKISLGIGTVCIAAAGLVSSSAWAQVALPRSHNAQVMVLQKGGSYLGIGGLDITAEPDSDAGEIGTVYQASNWVYVGKTTSDRMFLMPGQPPERAKSYRVLVKDWPAA